MDTEKKSGLNGFEIFFCILGILIFLSFIILPPIFRLVIPIEDEIVEDGAQEPSGEVVSLETNCNRQLNNLVEDYIIYSKDNVVEMIAITNTQDYDVITEDVAAQCATRTLEYQNINGLYYACSVLDNQIVTNVRVNTSQFNPNGPSPITVNYSLGFESLLQELEQSGFTCKR